MLKDGASKTLLRPAVLRAAHQLIDQPVILVDPLAVDLIPEASAAAIEAQADALKSPRLTLLRSAFVLRSRFCEDCIEHAVDDGIEQLVILGAGLETYPWRLPPGPRAMQIFVTDHPASAIHAKKVRHEAGLRDPSNVVLVDLDLEQRTMLDDLTRHGFRSDRPAIFTMLGLSQYLTTATIEHTARAIASCAAPSRLVLSYNPPATELDGMDLALARESPERASTFSEPWLFRPTTNQIMKLIHECGFEHSAHLAPACAQHLHFLDRTDGLRAPKFEQLLESTTG